MTMQETPVWAGRRLFFEEIDAYRDAGTGHGVYPDHPREEVEDPSDANLVSSLADDGPPWMHRPVIDIDHPCELVTTDSGRSFVLIVELAEARGILIDHPCTLVPSTTEGHFHLYIDGLYEWRAYAGLLKDWADCGVVEEGYYKAACRRGATFVRMPGVRKPKPDKVPDNQSCCPDGQHQRCFMGY